MKRIALCGSVKFIDKFFEVQKLLEDKGFEVLIPEELKSDMPKQDASRLHFSKVKSDKTDAILVVNCNKNGKDNYIGANTFAEVAFAFYFNKKIFLLNDMFDGCLDELEAWNAISLHGDLDKIDL